MADVGHETGSQPLALRPCDDGHDETKGHDQAAEEEFGPGTENGVLAVQQESGPLAKNAKSDQQALGHDGHGQQ